MHKCLWKCSFRVRSYLSGLVEMLSLLKFQKLYPFHQLSVDITALNNFTHAVQNVNNTSFSSMPHIIPVLLQEPVSPFTQNPCSSRVQSLLLELSFAFEPLLLSYCGNPFSFYTHHLIFNKSRCYTCLARGNKFTFINPCGSWFLSQQESVLQPSVIEWLAALLEGTPNCFVSGFIINDSVLMNVAYKNFSDTDSKPPTGCIKQGMFTLVVK